MLCKVAPCNIANDILYFAIHAMPSNICYAMQYIQIHSMIYAPLYNALQYLQAGAFSLLIIASSCLETASWHIIITEKRTCQPSKHSGKSPNNYVRPTLRQSPWNMDMNIWIKTWKVCVLQFLKKAIKRSWLFSLHTIECCFNFREFKSNQSQERFSITYSFVEISPHLNSDREEEKDRPDEI